MKKGTFFMMLDNYLTTEEEIYNENINLYANYWTITAELFSLYVLCTNGQKESTH